MPKSKSPPSENAKIATAALRLAAAKGWKNIKLDAVAKAAKIPPSSFNRRFTAKPDLIPVIVEQIDREAITAAGKPTGGPHDVLFHLLMTRFDILQRTRKAILSIAESARQDPKLSCILAHAVLASATRLATATKIDTPSPSILALGLAAVHAWAFLTWRKDETRDMSKTMAALDRALKLAGNLVQLIKPRS